MKTQMTNSNKCQEENTVVAMGGWVPVNDKMAQPCTDQEERCRRAVEQVQRPCGTNEGGSRVWLSLTHTREAEHEVLMRSLELPRAGRNLVPRAESAGGTVTKRQTRVFRILLAAHMHSHTSLPSEHRHRVRSVDCTQIPVNKCPRHCRKWNEAAVGEPATNKDIFCIKKKKRKEKPEVIKSPCSCKPVQASISLGKLDFISDL